MASSASTIRSVRRSVFIRPRRFSSSAKDFRACARRAAARGAHRTSGVSDISDRRAHAGRQRHCHGRRRGRCACRARSTCGSANISADVLIGLAGTPAASSVASSASRSNVASQRRSAPRAARRGWRRGRRWWRNRGSSAQRPGRPSTRRTCANWPSLPTARMTWPSATGKHLVGHDVRMRVAHLRAARMPETR